MVRSRFLQSAYRSVLGQDTKGTEWSVRLEKHYTNVDHLAFIHPFNPISRQNVESTIQRTMYGDDILHKEWLQLGY